MSNYKCYCAVCSGPLATSSVGIGRPLGQPIPNPAEEYTDDDDGAWEYENTYDRRIMGRNLTGWLNELRCLGFNEDAGTVGAAFVSGPAVWRDDEEVTVDRGTDPNAPEDTNFSCYRDDSFNGWRRVFPIHDACWDILTRALSGSFDGGLVNRDILYEVMECLVSGNAALDINYGDIKGPEQFWNSCRGEEYAVANPVELLPTVEEVIRESLAKTGVAYTDIVSVGSTENHFSRLPLELLIQIGLYLPTASILSFALSSRSCLEAVRTSGFWRKHLLLHMNWAWEIDQILIACEQIAERYFAQHDGRNDQQCLSSDTEVAENDGPSAKEAITEGHSGLKTEESIWFQNWNELSGSSATAEAIWDSDGILIGFGMIISQKQRFAGKSHKQVAGSVRETARVPTRPWMEGTIAHLDPAGAGIRGLTILGSDRYSNTDLGDTGSSLHQLVLVPNVGNSLVGLVLHSAMDYKIIGLKMIQSSRPMSDDIVEKDTHEPRTHRPIFWSQRTGRLEITNSEVAPMRAVPEEIQEKRLIPLTTNAKSHGKQPPGDFLPHEICLWSKDGGEATVLRGLSIYAPESSTGAKRIIRGLRANFARGHSTRKKFVGDFKNDRWGAPMDLWPAEDLVTLKIDGANGEHITQIAISPPANPEVIKITTSLAREVTAGATGANVGTEWAVYDVAAGQVIAGLCLAFAPVSDQAREGALSSLSAIIRGDP